MLFIHSSLSIWSKPAETPAGKRSWVAEYQLIDYIFLDKLKKDAETTRHPFLFAFSFSKISACPARSVQGKPESYYC